MTTNLLAQTWLLCSAACVNECGGIVLQKHTGDASVVLRDIRDEASDGLLEAVLGLSLGLRQQPRQQCSPWP